jgi:hypothetical protein
MATSPTQFFLFDFRYDALSSSDDHEIVYSCAKGSQIRIAIARDHLLEPCEVHGNLDGAVFAEISATAASGKLCPRCQYGSPYHPFEDPLKSIYSFLAAEITRKVREKIEGRRIPTE